MTQFGYRVNFDDSEMQTLQRALGHYLGICQREIKKGGGAPLIAHSGTIKRFRARLKKQLKQTRSFTLHESEMIAMEQALQRYLDACEREVANGGTTPFIADRAMISKICATLKDVIERTIISASLAWAARRQL
jgi:hypothetical protein